VLQHEEKLLNEVLCESVDCGYTARNIPVLARNVHICFGGNPSFSFSLEFTITSSLLLVMCDCSSQNWQHIWRAKVRTFLMRM